MRTKDLIMTRDKNDGIQKVYKFDNGFGASVVKTPYSYGGDKALWEIAVLEFGDNDEYNLTYSTDITDDVLGHLSKNEVNSTLDNIESLDANGRTGNELLEGKEVSMGEMFDSLFGLIGRTI